MAAWIRLGGTTPATEIAPHSRPTWETLADGGNGESSFTFGRSAKFASHLVKPDTLLEIWVGCMRVWFGRIGEYDRTTGEVIGRGIHTDGNFIPALDGSNNTTRTVQTAITTAIAAPWNWPINRNGVAGDLLGTSTDPMMVWAAITALADQLGYRATIDPDGALSIAPDPTDPTWTLAPEAVAFGATSEGQATHLVGVYDTGSGFAKTIRSDPLATFARGEAVDLTGRGTLTLAEANSILDAALAAGASQQGWVNGATIHREQITRNGTPAFLPAIHARSRMVRANGNPTSFGAMQATWVDTVLGKTKYTDGEEVIYLEPANKAPRTFVDVIAAA